MAAVLQHRYFDVLEFVRKSKEYGASEQLAEYQARQFEQALESNLEQMKQEVVNKDLATKADIRESELRLQKEIEMVRKEIADSKVQMIIWIAGLLMASGLIQHFFK